MSDNELRLLIAQLAEGTAATDRQLGSLASSVVAVRDAMFEYDPVGFEPFIRNISRAKQPHS